MCVAGFEERSLWLDGGRKEEEESKAPQTGLWERLATKCSALGRRHCRMAGGGCSTGDPLRQGVDTVTGDPEALSVADVLGVENIAVSFLKDQVKSLLGPQTSVLLVRSNWGWTGGVREPDYE